MLRPLIYRAFYLGFMFLANLLLANLLEPAGMGQMSLMILNASLIILITGLGSDGMALHALVQHKWTPGYGISFLTKVSLIQLAAFLFLEAMYWVLFRRSLLAQGKAVFVWIELFYFTGLLLTEKAMAAYYSFNNARQYNFLLLGLSVLFLILLSALWFWKTNTSSFSLFSIVAAHSFVQGLLLAMIFIFQNRKLVLDKMAWNNTTNIIKGASVIMITNVVQLLAYRVDYWLLRIFQSDYEIGLYAQANKFAALLWLIPNILAGLLIPKFGSLSKEGHLAVFRTALVLNLFMTVLTAVLTWCIYQFLLVPDYLPGRTAFWLMLPGHFAWALVIFFGAYFSWLGEFKTNLAASSVCLLLIGILDVALIPRLSFQGAAIANSVAYTAVLFLYLHFFHKAAQQKAADVFRISKNDFVLVKRLFR